VPEGSSHWRGAAAALPQRKPVRWVHLQPSKLRQMVRGEMGWPHACFEVRRMEREREKKGPKWRHARRLLKPEQRIKRGEASALGAHGCQVEDGC
jgi:hypothetical protein